MARHRVVFRDKHAKTLSRRTELMYRHISGIGQKSDDLNYWGSGLRRRPGGGEILADGEVIEDEIGTSEGVAQ